MKRKALIIFLCLTLVLVTLTGCGSTDTTPGTNEGNDKETFHVSIAAGRPGDMWYVLSHALATFINERSDWVTAEVVATAGVTDNTRLVMGEKELRGTHLNVTMLPGATVWGEGEYLPLQIGMLVMLNETFVTLDPNIETLADFSNKTVVLPRDAPDAYGWIFRNMLDLAGAKNYTLMHGGIDARLTALRDGAAEVGVLPFDFYYPNEFALSSGLMELGARGTLYFPNQGNVRQNLDVVTNACVADPFTGEKELPPLGMVAPAGSMGETQTEEMVYVSTPVYWSAGEEMPEEVVYEITRILYEAAENGDFEPYHAMGKGITTEFLAMSFWSDEQREAMFHPGALKLYQEKGVALKSFLD
ncbi:MAG TPA: TAXI family TRAP transporter solute-binding subunit [Oscillospiraceae bacterium]|nr:TAXI family TRAP transporter solute-binding subunit [Oscillospiraceae bacterium]